MPRRSKTDEELNWLRSTWGEFDEVGRDYAARCKITITPTAYRGVFDVAFEASLPPEGDETAERVLRTSARYPNSGMLLFLPWVWNMAAKLGEWVAEDVTQRRQGEK